MFTLRDACGLDIARAFALVTINPAKAAGIADEVGSIAVGKRADVLLVREISCGDGARRTMPVVTRAFVGGHSVFRSHYPDQPCGYGRDAEEVACADGAAQHPVEQTLVEAV
ncbi:amidohydrolase family protein [Eggerthella sinensis]|uniref:amidohydrolase family protein n=1 Tax=Eggerthella sinensis TaxID=242230 RepID=UPI0022E34BC3|nr:amidohydrolase family protein [Eggerthella sinensis]